MTRELLERILAEFGISDISDFSKVDKGYISHNYRVHTASGTYFLKQHVSHVVWQIDSIEKAESFFVDNGIQVVAPIKTKSGDLHTMIDEMCYVLYPFVTGISHPRGEIPEKALVSMGETLAKIHLLTKDGIQGEYKEFAYYKFGVKDKILPEIDQFLSIIESKKEKDSFDMLAYESLNFKKEFIEQCTVSFDQFEVFDRHLCHGDYHIENMFFDEQENVSHIFDLDMAGPAPRLYELVRSCMLSCFNHTYTDEKFEQAKIFIRAYYDKYPFEKKQLRDALEVFYNKQIFSTWLEKAHYLNGSIRADGMYKSMMDTIYYLRDHRQELFDRIWSAVS